MSRRFLTSEAEGIIPEEAFDHEPLVNMMPSSKEVQDQWKKTDTALSDHFGDSAMHIIYNVLYKHVERPPGS